MQIFKFNKILLHNIFKIYNNNKKKIRIMMLQIKMKMRKEKFKPKIKIILNTINWNIKIEVLIHFFLLMIKKIKNYHVFDKFKNMQSAYFYCKYRKCQFIKFKLKISKYNSK